MTQRAEVCLVGMHGSKNCCNYQKQLIAVVLWGLCSKDDSQKEVSTWAVPSNSALLKSGKGVPESWEELRGRLERLLGDELAEDYTRPTSPAHDIGWGDDRDDYK